MSIQAMAWVLDQDIPDANAKLVLMSLANALNGKTGRCFPSIEQIMKESSNSRSTVIRKLKWLEENNWVSIHSEFAQDGRQMANSYSLTYEGVTMTRGGVTMTRGGVNCDTGEGVNCDTPYKEPEEIPEGNKSNTNVLPKKTKKDFEIEFSQAFWPAYPNKVGKPFALKSFLKARQSASLEEIMAGLERYKTTKPADRAWCNPSTFLNQERWLDEPANVEQRNAGNYNNQQPMGNQVADKIRQLGANRDAKRGIRSSSAECSNAIYDGQGIDRERENANQIDNQRGQTIDLIACK